MTSATSPGMSRAQVWGVSLVLVALVGVRWFLHPGDEATVAGFDHTSAAFVLVADNLRAGRGYVNDVHWLVGLQPESLPLPYHNANPLFPTVVAGLAAANDLNTVAAGFAVSAAANVLLFLGLFWLATNYGVPTGMGIAVALAGTLWTPVFESSLKLGPDALGTALAIGCLACLLRTQGLGRAALGGVLFGLAWLTRGSSVLLLPALAVYLLLWNGPRRALFRLTVFGVLALLVALPWLVHTARVGGNPWGGAAGYSLWQGYYARAFGDSVERFWHSPEVPPSLGELLGREPGALARFYLSGIPSLFQRLCVGWCVNYRMAALVGLTALLGVWKLPAFAGTPEERRSYRPEVIALGVYALTLVLGFAPRGEEIELGAFDVGACFGAVLLAYAGMRAHQDRKNMEPARWVHHALLLTVSSLLWLYLTPLRNLDAWQRLATVDAPHAVYFKLARQAQERVGGAGPVVVGFTPYFYTFVNRVPALSIPESDDAYLLAYMRRYGARQVFLTREEIQFWRPHWLTPHGLPSWLHPLLETDEALVFERREVP